MSRLAQFSLAITISLMPYMLSCSSGNVKVSVPPRSAQRNETSTNLAVEIYLDGSKSMQGFTSSSSSQYILILQSLENAIHRARPNATIEFYKFGSGITKLIRKQFLDAKLPTFYTGDDNSLNTRIDAAIDAADSSKLTLILTDLFQQDNDLAIVSSKISNKYINQGATIGILGFKSEFDGTIFDVGPNKYNFPYNSGNNLIRFRPCYVIMIGNFLDVDSCYHYMNIDTLSRFIMISPEIIWPRISFSYPLKDSGNINEVSGLIVQQNNDDDRVRQFIIKNSQDKPYFGVTLPVHQVKGIPLFTGIVPQVACYKYYDDTTKIKMPQALMAFQTKFISDTLLACVASFRNDASFNEGSYLFEVNLIPAENNYSFPAWVALWDMDITKIEKWHQNQISFNGTTTFNLKSFIDNLWIANLKINRPSVGLFYCVVKKE